MPDATAQVAAGTVQTATLWFDGKASLGAFRGITHTAHGEMSGGASLAVVHGFVEADVASLTTDNSIRDHDMRKTMEVEKYRTIRFDLDSVSPKGASGDSERVELVGRMSIHGVTKPLRIPAVVRRPPGAIRVTGAFDVFLPAYGITNLTRFLGTLVMEKTIHVGLDVTFTTAREGREATER